MFLKGKLSTSSKTLKTINLPFSFLIHGLTSLKTSDHKRSLYNKNKVSSMVVILVQDCFRVQTGGLDLATFFMSIFWYIYISAKNKVRSLSITASNTYSWPSQIGQSIFLMPFLLCSFSCLKSSAKQHFRLESVRFFKIHYWILLSLLNSLQYPAYHIYISYGCFMVV